jgi:hypothetical protein
MVNIETLYNFTNQQQQQQVVTQSVQSEVRTISDQT